MSVKLKKLALVIFFWGVYARNSNDELQNGDKENEKGICYYPGSNVNTVVDINSFPVDVNRTVSYKCTDGNSSSHIQMFPVDGHSRQCLINGSWSGKAPICVHSLTKDFNNTVTFQEKYSINCTLSTVSEHVFQNEVFLSIYLYGPVWVDALDIEASEGLDIVVEGQSHPEVSSSYDEIERNYHTRLWYSPPFKVDSIMQVTVKKPRGKCKIKEFNILSQTGRSVSWCPMLPSMGKFNGVITEKVLPAGNICVQFPNVDTKFRYNFNVANENCHKLNGTLIQPLNNRLQLLLENNNNYVTRYYWIGLKKSDDSSGWKWANGENFKTSAFWANKKNTTKDCVALSLAYGYKWVQRNCDDSLKWICQTGYIACGYPDANPVTLMDITKDEASGFPKEVFYSCPPGFTLNGIDVRCCLHNGQWSDEAPFCERIIEDSTLSGMTGSNENWKNNSNTENQSYDVSTEVTGIEDNEMEDFDVSTDRTGNDQNWKNDGKNKSHDVSTAMMGTDDNIMLDSDNENEPYNVYTITGVGSVIAVVLVVAGGLLIWKMKRKINDSDNNRGQEDFNSFDSETLESTGELYEEISQERIISLNLHDSYENSYGYESINETPRNSSTIGDVNMNIDDVNTQPGIRRSLPLPTLAEERNSHLEDQTNEDIEMNVMGKTGFIMVENDLYDDSDIGNMAENT